MANIDFDQIYQTTLAHYKQAKDNIPEKRTFFEHNDAISNVIPGFDAEKLEFGSFAQENYAVLFVDMRQSTQRAQNVGAEKTFLTMHILLTALLEVVKYHHGKVIDIMGDGLMVFWGGSSAREKENMSKSFAAQEAGICGRDMLIVRKRVINNIISAEKLGPQINIGVGVTFDSVIVTKIGIPSSYDVKAFGDCINLASKYSSNNYNQVKVSKKIKDLWPKSSGGTISFKPVAGEDAYILN